MSVNTTEKALSNIEQSNHDNNYDHHQPGSVMKDHSRNEDKTISKTQELEVESNHNKTHSNYNMDEDRDDLYAAEKESELPKESLVDKQITSDEHKKSNEVSADPPSTDKEPKDKESFIEYEIQDKEKHPGGAYNKDTHKSEHNQESFNYDISSSIHNSKDSTEDNEYSNNTIKNCSNSEAHSKFTDAKEASSRVTGQRVSQRQFKNLGFGEATSENEKSNKMERIKDGKREYIRNQEDKLSSNLNLITAPDNQSNKKDILKGDKHKPGVEKDKKMEHIHKSIQFGANNEILVFDKDNRMIDKADENQKEVRVEENEKLHNENDDEDVEMNDVNQAKNTEGKEDAESRKDAKEEKEERKQDIENKIADHGTILEKERGNPIPNMSFINQEIIQDVINNEIKNTRERMLLVESINSTQGSYATHNENIDSSLLEQSNSRITIPHIEEGSDNEESPSESDDEHQKLPEKIAVTKKATTSEILEESSRILERVKSLKDSNFSSRFMTLREEQAHISALPMILVAPRTLPMEVQIGINSLPNLDNLASQILRFFVVSSFEEIKTILEDPDGEEFLALNVLVHLFTTAKSLYTRDVKNFITIEDITPGITNSLHDYESTIVGREEIFDNTIKKTNLATFICAVTSLIDINLIELNESFMDVFTSGYLSSDSNSGISLISSITGIGMPGKLTRTLGDLFLELKTQAYIANCTTKNADDDDNKGNADGKDSQLDNDNECDMELEFLFPDNLQEILTESAELKVNVPAEKEFVQKCASRKVYLKEAVAVDELLEKYPFIEFVKRFLTFISKNIGFTIYGKRISQGGNRLTLWSNNSQSDFASYTTDPQSFKRTQDAIAKDTSSKKKQKINSNGTSDRRLWTTEELDCLISSIKEYGAQWTKILQVHGNGGAKSEILRNRSTTQLKDKARNIKIQFLKNDQKLPNYLQKVPGELEKSGPRARRKN